jgi:hypothetical protein
MQKHQAVSFLQLYVVGKVAWMLVVEQMKKQRMIHLLMHEVDGFV